MKNYINTDLNDLQYYKDIISLMPGHVYWKDRNGVFLGCNFLQAKHAGLNSPEEIIGKTDFDMPWAAIAEHLRKTDVEVMASDRPISREELFEHLDGTRAVYMSNKIPMHDDNGNVVGILGISIDITKQKN